MEEAQAAQEVEAAAVHEEYLEGPMVSVDADQAVEVDEEVPK